MFSPDIESERILSPFVPFHFIPYPYIQVDLKARGMTLAHKEDEHKSSPGDTMKEESHRRQYVRGRFREPLVI